MKQQSIKFKPISALATCLIMALSICIAIPLAGCNNTEAEAGKVTMEINPGVEYVITGNINVKSVRFLNDDAKGALEEVELKGQSLKTAVALTIAAYKTIGYMERNDTVLISFDKKLSENAKLKKVVSDELFRTFEKSKSVHSMVCVAETSDAKTAALAEKHGISQGKAKLVADAAANSDLLVEDIVNLPLDEIIALQKDIDSTIIDSKYIGILKAKAIALADAGVLTRVEFTEARLIDNGVKYPYYRLVFNDKHTQWTYLINAVNGDILEKNEVALFISLEEAKAIALKHSGIDNQGGAVKVVFTREELSRNQGRPCWILEFYTAEFQYAYKIDAKTGEIILADYHIDIRKAKEIALTDAGVFAEIEKISFTVEGYAGGGIKTPYFYFVFNNATTQWTYRIDAISGGILEKSESTLFIPLQRAREIALNDAGITDVSEATFTKEELNRSIDDRPCWVLEFYTEKYQFGYRIDAETGEIVFSTRYISMSRAKEIALEDAGIPVGNKVVFTVEKLVDGGIKTPYYLFEFNDGRTRWTYRIDATNGSVIFRDKEVMMISLERAKEIALADAEIPDGVEVVFTLEVLSRNSGRPCWVLEFYIEKYQFSYKVDAKTGEVIFNRRYIYIEIAREVALKDAVGEETARVEFTVEELIDGGIKTPYYLFVFNDDETRWTYRIDATRGEIQFSEKEKLNKAGL
ncbi:MAG: PepSY domain-containing protein [Candidatus Borkfalkiaceae bacterium]|nr:PepSY domain-containing protein [Christensenellaceae bacterium]